jgi:hypothetical protein
MLCHAQEFHAMSPIQSEHFTQALLNLLDETFENVHGFFLDKNNSLFETLAHITSEEASSPVGGKCATLAAQVKHVAFYLDVFEKSTTDAHFPKVDWGEIWRTISQVTPEEWLDIQKELRTSYERVLDLIRTTPTWESEDEIGNVIAVIVHTSYHLGEIRQALCTLRE